MFDSSSAGFLPPLALAKSKDSCGQQTAGATLGRCPVCSLRSRLETRGDSLLENLSAIVIPMQCAIESLHAELNRSEKTHMIICTQHLLPLRCWSSRRQSGCGPVRLRDALRSFMVISAAQGVLGWADNLEQFIFIQDT